MIGWCIRQILSRYSTLNSPLRKPNRLENRELVIVCSNWMRNNGETIRTCVENPFKYYSTFFSLITISHGRLGHVPCIEYQLCTLIVILHLGTRFFCSSSLGLVTLTSMGKNQDGCTMIKVYFGYPSSFAHQQVPHNCKQPW